MFLQGREEREKRPCNTAVAGRADAALSRCSPAEDHFRLPRGPSLRREGRNACVCCSSLPLAGNAWFRSAPGGPVRCSRYQLLSGHQLGCEGNIVDR
ncbi:unnamed protein product [Arctogadus glacialis]